MNRNRLRVPALVSAILAISFVGSPQSIAEVQKTGTRNCPTGQYVTIVAKGSAYLSFYYPSGRYRQGVDMGVGIGTWTVNTQSRSTSWKVTSTGLLDDPGTYGTCTPSPSRR